MPKTNDALMQWLSLRWDRPERSYNPDLRDFLAGVMDYPKKNVVTEDAGPSGYPDLKLVSPEGIAWVVGDLKKDDAVLTDPAKREALWQDKRKYVDGLTRYALFLTPHFLWICLPNGDPHAAFAIPLDLSSLSLEELRARLTFLNYETSGHGRQWEEFTTGTFPYSYLTLTEDETLKHLRGDLRAGFTELTKASVRAITILHTQYQDYLRKRNEIERNLLSSHESQRRARVRVEQEYTFVRHLFTESLPQFEEQYGREAEGSARVQEAFIADSVAALMARVLFLRLVEDLGLTRKRRLSNGGPRNWAVFVEYLTGDARALVRVACEDVARLYREPFAETVFDWIHYANGELDETLQRYILRLNAYDFSGLSEEILGDIYQQFLPLQKRKQLGEYYTPRSIVDWILDRTVGAHGLGTVLDPSCGSGSFLVRYAHRRLEDAEARNLDRVAVRRELQEEVWGFDLNPFAAFISLFQVTWALLRFLAQGDPPHVHVYNINSLLRDTDIAPFVGVEHLAPGSMARDEQHWKYIIGNPPYIRAERVKYGGEMRELWGHVWGQNADTGIVFLYRALKEWLEPGGFLGMVVSGGYANSKAAAKVWNLLQLGGEYSLRKVVWLEFVGRVWDASVIPMILVMEHKPPQPDDEIELYAPSAWPSDELPEKISYRQFFDKRISPNETNQKSEWGDYLLPLLHSEDVPLLQKLYPDDTTFTALGNVAKWTYGIQRGGVELTEQPTGTKPIQVIAGRSLAVAWPGTPVGWVDLDTVEQRPYGKLSLWGGRGNPDKFIAIATLGQVPFAAVVESQGTLAAINTTIVSREVSAKPEAIASYLNSQLAHFYWFIRLRTAVLEGSSRATIYPRTFEVLPWPKHLTPAQEQALVDGYDQLAALAARAKDNPNEWLLAETERRLEAGHLRLTDPQFGLRFAAGSASVLSAQLQHDGTQIKTELLIFAEVADPDLADYLYRLLTLTTEEDSLISASDVQKLLVPRDYAALMQEYRQRDAGFQSVEQDFRTALAQVDTSVYEAFGITADEQAYIAARLAVFPLNRLKPRYPWETVRPRPIKAYMEDRFR